MQEAVTIGIRGCGHCVRYERCNDSSDVYRAVSADLDERWYSLHVHLVSSKPSNESLICRRDTSH